MKIHREFLYRRHNFIKEIVSRRKLSMAINIHKHLAERSIERGIDVSEVVKVMNLLANKICQTVFEFKIGNKPYVQYKDVRLALEFFNDKVQVMTIFRREDGEKIGVFSS